MGEKALQEIQGWLKDQGSLRARACLESSAELKKKMLEADYLEELVAIAEVCATAIQRGGKLLLCGNGGSAADAQHLAAELLVRLRSDVNRQSLPAISLAMDSSTLTACGNDYGYEQIFARALSGLGCRGDVLLAITTSGNSPNVLRALETARKMNISTIGFLGCEGGEAAPMCDRKLVVPSKNTARIQEVHITIGHILMELIEDALQLGK